MILFLFFMRPLSRSIFFRAFCSCEKNAQGARLRLMFFAPFAKNIKHNALFLHLQHCIVFAIFAPKPRKKANQGAHLRIFPFKRKGMGKMLRNKGRVEKQSQKQSQNPGGNPPDPFFLLIIDYFVP
ncbi:MAG: hypothetical protein H7829_11130 [Magnetococcus sp. THC-1_WYH]